MRDNKRFFSGLDWPLFSALILILILGFFTVYSVAYNAEHPSVFDVREKYGKQLLWIGISLFLGLLILLIDAEIFRKYAAYIYAVTLALLIIVLFMPPIHGARAWLGIGGLGIQPAEFAKISTAIFLSKLVSEMNIKLQGRGDVLKIIGVISVPAFLIAIQPDAGTLLVFSSFFFVLYREGLSLDPLFMPVLGFFFSLKIKNTWLGTHFIPVFFYVCFLCVFSLYLNQKTFTLFSSKVQISGINILILIHAALASLGFLFFFSFGIKRERKRIFIVLAGWLLTASVISSSVSFVFNNFAAQHQKNRIELVLGLKEDPNGIDYNRNRAMASVGSGGLWGKGYKQASISSLATNHVPESETDFIFCPFAEEWGFMGSALLFCLYVFIIFRVFAIAERQRSVFHRFYCNCVGMILFYHFAINIGMNIGLAPVIGIPLPFFSCGGSAILSFCVMMFLLLKLDSQRKDVLR